MMTSIFLLVKSSCRTNKTIKITRENTQKDESEPALPISELKYKLNKLTIDILTQMLTKWGMKPKRSKDQLVEQVVATLKPGNRILVS